MTWKADVSVWLEKPSVIQVFSDDGQEQDYVPEMTCKVEEYENTGIPVCSECGAIQPEDYTVYYCWCCGRKVV